MRAKICKRLRQIARQNSNGMPERRLLAKTHRKSYYVNGENKPYTVQHAVNDPKTTRGVYRMLKKNLHIVKQPKEKTNG